MRTSIEPAALAEISEAYDWYEKQRAGYGERFVTAVDAALARIQNNPELYAVAHNGLRRVLLGRFPYFLAYRVQGGLIVVVACMHARRDPNRWMFR